MLPNASESGVGGVGSGFFQDLNLPLEGAHVVDGQGGPVLERRDISGYYKWLARL